MESGELASASSWLHWLTVIKYLGGAMVVIGVVAELLGDWFSEPLQKKLDDARKLELAELHKESDAAKLETARLSKEAESARADIAKANTETAKANERAALLETIAAWRHLTSEQHDKIADAVRGHTLQVKVSYIGDPEANSFAAGFAKALRDGGLQPINGGTINVNPPLIGLYLVSANGSDVLEAALRSANITFKPMNITPPPPIADLWIGGREQPFFGNNHQ